MIYHSNEREYENSDRKNPLDDLVTPRSNEPRNDAPMSEPTKEESSQAVTAGASAFKEVKGAIPASTEATMNQALSELSAGQSAWRKTAIHEKIEVLKDLLQSLKQAGKPWVDAALKAKGIDPKSPTAGEEWLAGPQVTARNIRLLKDTLTQIEKHGKPVLPYKPERDASGKVRTQVFPVDTYDTVMFPGFTGEVWMHEGVEVHDVYNSLARSYREPLSEVHGASLVLGAGNVASIGPMDTLHKVFIDHKAVILKMNPVNEYLGPHIEAAFKPLIDRGLLRIVYGGAKEGQYLCSHEDVSDIHITGSDKTHDAIVYGTGAEGARRKASRKPILEKPISSELGNVSPVIVVPGPWSKSDCAFQGENLASMLTNNAGFNCNATRVIITQKDWQHREELLDGIRSTFKKTPLRKAYYPGAEQRHEQFLEAHPEAECLGKQEAGTLPWTLISNLDENKPEDICFNVEAFCSVTSEVPLQSNDTVDFIKKAVAFANDSVWGSLNASIIVHPQSLKDPAVAQAVEEAIHDLKAGSIGVNHWAALSYVFCSTTWGAYPGHPLHDIRSGQGAVHNTFMFEDPEKSVIRGPFRPVLKPAWFASNKTAHKVAEELFYFEIDRSLTRLPALGWHGIRG